MVRRRGAWCLTFVAMAGLFGACDADEQVVAAPAEDGERGLEANGFRLNGFRLNGFRLNGFRLNGAELHASKAGGSIELEKITLADDVVADEAWEWHGDLHVWTEYGEHRSGPELIGAELEFTLEDGWEKVHKVVRIDDVAPLGEGSPVLLYDLSIQENDGPWVPLCTDIDGERTEAMLLGDVWDPNTGDRVTPRPERAVTFACRDAALGKCVEWGYVPWIEVDGISLADHHQTCTRAVRADYCGDGVAHTTESTVIHILDELGIQDADLYTAYLVEAEWGPDGAACLNPENARHPSFMVECSPQACGSSFASGGLIQTGIPDAP